MRGAFLLIGCLLALPGAAGQADLEVVASGFSFVLEGDTAVPAGSELVVAFRNDGTMQHNLHVADGSDADDTHTDTKPDVALAHTADLEPGDRRQLIVDVPKEVTSLYFWCDVGDHEAAGMWAVAGVVDGGEGRKSPPGPFWAALGVILFLAILRGAGRPHEGGTDYAR